MPNTTKYLRPDVNRTEESRLREQICRPDHGAALRH